MLEYPIRRGDHDQTVSGGTVSRLIKVLIADDHFVVRRGTRALLLGDGAEDLEVVGEAENGQQAVELALRLHPDIILMDLMMPEMDGIEAIYEVRAQRPAIRIIAMTGAEVDDRVIRAVQAGARGFLAKSAQREEILSTIRRVFKGEVALSHEITRKMLQFMGSNTQRSASDGGESLTTRETEILRLVARGLSNQAIAGTIHISEATVRTHVSHILSKLALRNRVEAALFALRSGLASLEDEGGNGGA